MSVENGNGKGNLAISYLFPEKEIKKQVELEQKLKNEIAEVLSRNGIKKFYIADDEFINENLTKQLEGRIK